MSVRTRAMDRAAVRRRRDEAEAYYEVAVLCAASSSHADWKAAGANAVLGGIAAADAICGAVLGYHHVGEDHAQARRLLDTACSPDRQPGNHLKRLTDEKSNFQYSSSRVSRSQTNRLVVALERLVVTMRQKTDPTS
ncbi:hypothetical protein DEJ16_09935 [Curtobacterium sp. MCJR17_055]|uniref:hypothetical protein n=1 Tax=unclassified Curtobacterium TaxID=257496 RepID=UPI000D895E2A|nr:MULTISPECIES: hypothetical protein [unclassified Curtobacterium]PYY32186.1 hypothetical protein DEI87_15120 [Curtobacterium sp. MCBD17_029]PYY54658.1 hypothetical protein DEJ16_09935 [Curtobacterium sp. MCJR17_055]PYY60893.1 hypothetical protein DEJ26_03085 [Curtobacterium sp. MCPF17_015]WIB35502.1 hypothetical protein DEJ15_14945 [Curtobacterium sp. MCJR17_043]